ncbi:Repeat domain-containing protein [Catalinimonas alkaloidigena]|uniref:Repeat domain-containing protein n=1 Tax=Catalinimonas alkaloidigena TaxID=1075417 RepID=A0A1G9MTL7_9BACT|nr:VCBS repeat-containing protein [Catalinimonas alkaloidigena]SDL77351.1 Repeat domain-containing protein [Catalinimonas alkaloidigena]
MMKRCFWGSWVALAGSLAGCSSPSAPHEEKTDPLFVEQAPKATGVTFANRVVQEGDNNVLSYPYFFNGGGVAVGDLNNDGLPDLYFTGNQVPNRLYLNKGNFEFEDITERAGVVVPEGWKTGVTLADVNGDGWLDLYVCRSAVGDPTLRRNLLFINNQDLTFTERAADFGLADEGYSTHAAFFDYDHDGDLDLFVLNHSLPKYAGFSKLMATYKQETNPRFASQLYRNDGGAFTNVTEAAGITGNVLSFGLGLAVADLNDDGWQDVYVSNDFNEEDYLFLNQQNGTFRNVLRDAMGHTSLFSMGSDVADINNDGRPDLLTLDMLPETNERIKLSSGDDNFDKYRQLLRADFHPQTMRNMLQLNQGVQPSGVPLFAEVGQLAGISNTDWSWAALFADFDGDGWKDLFISNGYDKDYTNMQFLKYMVDERVKAQRTGQQPTMQQILDSIPSIQVGNYLFRNTGPELGFAKVSQEWGIDRAFKSNGAAYADLDEDGDLDLIINTLNEPAVLYRNQAVEQQRARFLRIDLREKNEGQPLVGTKVWVHQGERTQFQEFSPVRGYQSCMDVPLSFGLGADSTVDSVRVVYPDARMQVFRPVDPQRLLAPDYQEATQRYTPPVPTFPLFTTETLGGWTHTPVDTNDFKRQLLLPYQFSYSGPRLAVGDIDGDGRNDFYACGAKDQPGALWQQQANGSFQHLSIPAWEADRASQDEDALFFDADGDGDLDLYVVSGGYGFAPGDPALHDRLYLNDGSGQFTKASDALPTETDAGSCVATLDLNGDGALDLFVGNRFVPGQYPIPAASQFLLNDGRGHFTATAKDLGMVCDAQPADVNGDGKPDLIVVGEWTPIRIFLSQGDQVSEQPQELPETQGWWNCVLAEDFDQDGDIDLIVGNYGQNAQFQASSERPVTLTYADFDDNGQVDPFLNYFVGEQTYPFASRDEALGQINGLKKKYLNYTSYANTTLPKMFSEQELAGATTLEANELRTLYFENQGGQFIKRALPVELQFSPVFALLAFDYDQDGDLDLLAGGNITQARVRVGPTDANHVQLFQNQDGAFTYQGTLGLTGDVRDVQALDAERVLIGVNGGPLRVAKVLRQESL